MESKMNSQKSLLKIENLSVEFCSRQKKFTAVKNVNLEITRNAIQENEVLDTFVQTGFMLDSANARLVLANDEKIYNFLSKEIEDYMKKFEVLVAEDFKKKDIKKLCSFLC